MDYRFKKMYVEITNVCNLDCNFCPKNSRPNKFMKTEEFDIITSKLSGFGRYLFFHVMGEPLLHPELGDFLDISLDKGFMVNITTNGTLLNEKSDILLNSKALRQVNISLHSYEANSQTMSLEQYLEIIADFTHKALKYTDMLISFRLWNTQGADKNNDKIIKFIKANFNLDHNLVEELNQKKRVKLADKLYLNAADKFDWPDMEADAKGGRAFCYGLRDQIGILSDGTVIPCCLDNEGTIDLGNIFNDTLANILESNRVKEIYKGFSEGKAIEELCQKCGYRRRF